jgi:hypothetical protein
MHAFAKQFEFFTFEMKDAKFECIRFTHIYGNAQKLGALLIVLEEKIYEIIN